MEKQHREKDFTEANGTLFHQTGWLGQFQHHNVIEVHFFSSKHWSSLNQCSRTKAATLGRISEYDLDP